MGRSSRRARPTRSPTFRPRLQPSPHSASAADTPAARAGKLGCHPPSGRRWPSRSASGHVERECIESGDGWLLPARDDRRRARTRWLTEQVGDLPPSRPVTARLLTAAEQPTTYERPRDNGARPFAFSRVIGKYSASESHPRPQPAPGSPRPDRVTRANRSSRLDLRTH